MAIGQRSPGSFASDEFVNVGNGRFLADHIRGARYLDLDGNDHIPWFGGADTLLERSGDS